MAPANCPAIAAVVSASSPRFAANSTASSKLEVFATLQNLFDKIAPLDPLTYGATGYNPLDYAGAAGRFISAGVKYKF